MNTQHKKITIHMINVTATRANKNKRKEKTIFLFFFVLKLMREIHKTIQT